MQLAQLLTEAVRRRASDILLAVGAPAMFRISGELCTADDISLTAEHIELYFADVLNDEQRETLDRQHDVDFSIGIEDLGRFRLNVHRQKGSLAAAIRHIPTEMPRLEQMNLPPVIEKLTQLDHGLVLVTGQTGSGKSTTLAAMIDRINRRDPKHIITLEDPIEFRFSHGRSLIEQREIGTDCPSFASGLKHVLRQDPDVILVGELRDLDTIRTTLQAAETGHLVLGTLHSSTAAGAVDRIIEVFPADEQMQIRSHLAQCLRAVITQRLLRSADGKGRVAAAEILVITRAIQTSIREATTHLIEGMMSTGRRHGMQTMEQALQELVLNGCASIEEIEDNTRQQEGLMPVGR